MVRSSEGWYGWVGNVWEKNSWLYGDVKMEIGRSVGKEGLRIDWACRLVCEIMADPLGSFYIGVVSRYDTRFNIILSLGSHISPSDYIDILAHLSNPLEQPETPTSISLHNFLCFSTLPLRATLRSYKYTNEQIKEAKENKHAKTPRTVSIRNYSTPKKHED